MIMSVAEQYKPAGFTAEDIVLFDNARNGDIQAYGNLFERYIDSILFAYQHDSRMEYDDLRQNVYLKTFPNLFKIKDIRAWWSFCHKTARGLLKDAEKKNKPLLYDDNTDAKTNAVSLADSNRYSSPDFNLLNEEIRHELLNEVKTLSEIDQRISFLFFIEEFTIAKISEELNMPWSTVNDHINSIRNKLSKSKKLQSLRQYGLCPVLLQRIFEFGNTGTQTAGSGIFKGIISLFTSVVKWCFSLVGMIFAAMLWLTSCLILGTKGMAEFGKSANGTGIRVAFIRYCFIGYLLMMFYPVIHRTLVVYIPLLLTDYWPKTTSRPLVDYGTNLIGLFLFIGYIIYARVRFRHLQAVNSSIETSDDEMDQTKCKLRRFVNIGSLLIGFNAVFFCFFYLLGLYTVPLNSIKFLFVHNTWDSLVPGLICFGGYHLFSWKTFSNLVSNIDREYSPDLFAKNRRNGVRMLTVAGMVFTLHVPIFGLLYGEKSTVAFLFVSGYFLIWGLFMKWNKNKQLMFPVFVVAIILFVFLRVYMALFNGWE